MMSLLVYLSFKYPFVIRIIPNRFGSDISYKTKFTRSLHTPIRRYGTLLFPLLEYIPPDLPKHFLPCRVYSYSVVLLGLNNS